MSKDGMHDVNWHKIFPKRIPVILRDLAPTNAFNPTNLWPIEDEQDVPAATAKKEAKKEKKAPVIKKADMIRMQIAKDLEEKKAKQDEEKLGNAKSVNLMTMKMATPAGRLKQLYEIMKKFLSEKNYIDAVDTLWEIQHMPRSNNEEEIAVHKKYKKYAKKTIDFLKDSPLIPFQLTEMSDRLPPLNLHHMNKFILDSWQKEVLTHIDKKHSVIVCAPTSSGKTVLSSYVTVVGGKVLFIAPTEPLAWQVAALFQSLVKGAVGVITNGTVFLPESFRVAVGTPAAVESALLDIGYDFDYCVFDEVHDLNGPEGDALERIVKGINCPFLALSATIGNASVLSEWWKKHHPNGIHLLEYRGRFINLQRLVFEGNKVVPLHPCAAVTVDYLKEKGFDAGDLAFTPRDTYALYKEMRKAYPKEAIADLKPEKYFESTIKAPSTEAPKEKKKSSKKDSKDKKDKKDKKKDADDDDMDFLNPMCHRITLLESKQYEEAVKTRLQQLSLQYPTETQQILDKLSYTPPATTSADLDITSLIFDLCSKQLIPAICFQLDSVRCRQLFDKLLAGVEAAQDAKYPGYRAKVEAEFAEWEKAQVLAKKAQAKSKSLQEDEAREAQEFQETNVPDIYAPHPEFVLTPPGHRLSAAEFREIKWQLRRELSEDSDDGHPLVRSLRRGIGIYNANLPAAYLRIVQSLAQAGRLAVVFSDDSLAYGVNMPFRTCCFCEDDAELSSLMAQQMAGRAGRRGLDRQGNIVFAGLAWTRMQTLMRGLLPNVVGNSFSLYPTMYLQKSLSDFMNDDLHTRMASHSLPLFIQSKPDEDYLAKSMKYMQIIGLVGPNGQLIVDTSIARLMWECRHDCAEAMGIYTLLELMLQEFGRVPGDNIGHQMALFNMILRVIGREPYHPEYACGGILEVVAGQEEVWDKVSVLLEKLDEKVTQAGCPELRLPVPLNAPLDGYVWRTVVDNMIPPGLETAQLNAIKKRMRHVGDKLRLMHNLLMYSGRYGVLEEIVRKCFRQEQPIRKANPRYFRFCILMNEPPREVVSPPSTTDAIHVVLSDELSMEMLLSPTSKVRYRAGGLLHQYGFGFVKNASFKHKYFRLREHGLLGYVAQDAHEAALEVLFTLGTTIESIGTTTFVLKQVNIVQPSSWLKVVDPVAFKAQTSEERDAWVSDIVSKLDLLKKKDEQAKHRKLSLIPIHNAEDLLFSATADPPYYRTFLNKFLMLGEIGEGSFSVVRKGVDRLTAEMCAIKCSKPTPSLLEEVAILKLLSHPSIIGLHGVYKTNDMFYIVMDYMADGDLCDRLIQVQRFPEHEVRRIIAQVAKAIHHIHSLNIIHRDIKPENILLHKDSVKIADFGLAKRILDPTVQFQKGCGTPEYAAPELLYGRPYGTQSDLFSLGVVMYVLLFGAFPFTVASAAALQRLERFSESGDVRDMSCLHPANPQWQYVSAHAQEVILKLLEINPDKRLTASQLLQHPWIADILSDLPQDNDRLSDCTCIGFLELMCRGIELIKHNQSGKEAHASILSYDVPTRLLSWTPASTIQQNPKKHFNAKDHPRTIFLPEVVEIVRGCSKPAFAKKRDPSKEFVCLSIQTPTRTLDVELATPSQRDFLYNGLERLLKTM
ncbi:DEAD/DEAH box RNA helicase [Thraustotheca clavata]|uniref:DEAD/DEAH box RNA helicase n=1 Tax=Thraustotheca clavata TaxID=74557 RepID=A0A1V9ZWN9_9STRA|nr:DEAD/DEAH box RNA helicase [Thraustotheca clavata]